MFLLKGDKIITIKSPAVLYKTLIVGIIVLLIGVGIQPAFANNVNISTSNFSEDDCDICQPVSKKHLM
jgi:hypothetical protein